LPRHETDSSGGHLEYLDDVAGLTDRLRICAREDRQHRVIADQLEPVLGMPSVLRYNRPATEAAQKSIGAALGAPDQDASEAFATFIDSLGLPRRLADVGVQNVAADRADCLDAVIRLRTPPSHSLRGTARDRHERCGEMRWTRQCMRRAHLPADGEVMWSWRPDAVAKLCKPPTP
jgi:hypothetical protein